MDNELFSKFESFLSKKLNGKFQALLDDYDWPLKTKVKDANETIKYRLQLSSKLKRCKGERRKIILKKYLNSWGGMHLSDKTIRAYVDSLSGKGNKLRLLNDGAGISSKSKALSLWSPHKYFIYDSYVAIALNYYWFTCKDTKEHPCPFPTCESRRPETQIVNYCLNSLKSSSKEPKDFYSELYLPLIKSLAEKLGETKNPEKLEMTLFVKGRKITDALEPKIKNTIKTTLNRYLKDIK